MTEKGDNATNTKGTTHATDENGDKHVQKPRHGAPPDGGWGWIVVLSSFSISLLVDGVCFSFGIFFDEFRAEFGANKGDTSWIGSVLNGSYLIFGPLISALVNMYGCRVVAMSGAILSFIAFFISTFSNSIGLFIFTYGFLGGIGFGLMYLPAIVMVGYYFERRRALATGIACCGSGIGAFLFAPFTEFLLHEFGWRGATWIISALVFNGVFFAIFYRPLPKPSATEVKGQYDKKEPERPSPIYKGPTIEIDNREWMGLEKTNSIISQKLKEQIYEHLKSEPKLKPEHRTSSMTLHPPQSGNTKVKQGPALARLAYSHDFGMLNKLHRVKRPEVEKPMERKDIFYSGSLWHLQEFKKLGSIEEFRDEMTSHQTEAKVQEVTGIGKFLQALKSVFDLSLLRSPTFLMYGVSCFLCMGGFFVPFIYLPTHAVDLGLDSTKGAFLISIIGITNTVGRVAVGFISDQPWADCLLINNIALIVGGVATIFVPLYPEYYLLAIYSCVFGTAIAVFVSLRSIIMVELMGLEKLTTAFGFVIMCQGMSSFVGAPIAGAISDATGNYNAAFYLAGVTLTLSGLICLPLRRVSVWENSKKNRRVIYLEKPSELTSTDVEHSGESTPMV